MRHAVPWNVKGVDRTAREAAREAAERAGMSLGDWLNAVISDHVQDPSEPGLDAVARRLESVAQRIERHNRRSTDTAGPSARLPKDGDNDLIRALDAVTRLADLSERRSAAAIEAVEAMASDRPAPAYTSAPRANEPVPSDLAQRMERLEARIADLAELKRDTPSSIERKLGDVADTLKLLTRDISERRGPSDPSHDRRLASMAGALRSIEQRLAEREQVRLAPPEDSRLSDIAKSIDAMRAAVAAASQAPRAFAPPQDFGSDMNATISEIVERQRMLDHGLPETNLGSGGSTTNPFVERLDAISRQLNAVRGSDKTSSTADRSIRAELQELSKRISAMNGRTQGRTHEDELRNEIKGLSRQLGVLTSQQDPRLGAELRALSEHIEALRGDVAPIQTFDRLQSDLHALTEQLASTNRHGHLLQEINSAVHRLPAVDDLADEIRAISKKLDLAADRGVPDERLDRLFDETRHLRDLIEDGVSPAGIERLANEIRALSERVDGLPGIPSRVEDMALRLENRIAEIADRLQAPAREPLASNPQLEDAIRLLTDKLETMHSGAGSEPRALADLERQIITLAQKIDQSTNRSDQLGAIERGLSDLFVQLEEMRSSTLDAAQKAAKAPVVGKAGAGSTGTEIETLRREVDAVRDTTKAAEQRAHSSLDGVQQTLERVVDRISRMEMAPPSSTAPLAATQGLVLPPSAQPAVPSPPATPPRATAAPAPSRSIDTPLGVPTTASVGADLPIEPSVKQALSPRIEPPVSRPVAPSGLADSDQLLEPGMGAPRVRPPAPSTMAAGTSRPDFIAAARRAAQAAAVEAKSQPQPSRADQAASLFNRLKDKVAKPKAEPLIEPASARIEEPRSERGKKAAPTPHITDDDHLMEQDSAPSSFSGKRRTIIIGIAAALLIIAAGISMMGKRGGSDGEAVTQPTTPPAAQVSPQQPATATPEAPVTSQSAPAQVAPNSPEPDPSVPARESRATPPRQVGVAFLPSPVGAPAPARPQSDAQLTTGSVGTQAAIPPAPGTSISPSGWQPVGTDGRPATPLASFPQRLRQAAEQGDLAAAFEVGTRHLEGRGVPANPSEAARWYQRAAEGGIAPAQYRLGSLLEKGTGVPRDVARARSLYERAAEAGNGKAMHNLAVLFAQGAVGDRPDYRAASLWFRRAAEIGVADSQYNLGILYARGLGVDQNLAESYKWFALAALGGDQDAGSKRDEVAGRIDAQTLVAARLAVQTFTPRAEPDAAVRVAAPAGGWGDEVRPAPSQTSQQRRTPGATQR